MAVTGLSIPAFAKYANNNGTITYSDGQTLGHAISYSVDLTTSEDNPLYGDNIIVENDVGTFQSGTLTLTTSELTPEMSYWLLGLAEKSISYTPPGASTASSAKVYAFDDDINPAYLGFGIIEQTIINGEVGYHAVVLPKIMPHIPADAANTRGETIEWQTHEIEFSIYRDDSSKHTWKYVSEDFDTEAEAIAFLTEFLGLEGN